MLIVKHLHLLSVTYCLLSDSSSSPKWTQLLLQAVSPGGLCPGGDGSLSPGGLCPGGDGSLSQGTVFYLC